MGSQFHASRAFLAIALSVAALSCHRTQSSRLASSTEAPASPRPPVGSADELRAVVRALHDRNRYEDLGVEITKIAPEERDTAERFPEVVAVGDDQGWHCSGFMISPRLVLTANHCGMATRIYTGPRTVEALASRQFAVDLVRASIPSGSDLALFRLKAAPAEPLPYFPLVTGCGKRRDLPLTTTLVGFGGATSSARSVDLRGSGLSHFGPATCAGATNSLACNETVEFAVVAKADESTNCYGDSGGPMLVSFGGRRGVVGVISRTLDGGTCGVGGIFERVDDLSTLHAQFKEVTFTKCE